MLTFCILFSLSSLFFYMLNKYKKESRELVFLLVLYSICITWSVYLLIDNTRPTIYIEIVILSMLIFVYIYIQSIEESVDPINIVAIQQNYWEVDSKTVIKSFDKLSNEKEDRVEVSASLDNLYSLNNDEKILSPTCIAYFKELEKKYKSPSITNINEIKKYPLHDKIFKKLVDFIEIEKELTLDYSMLINKLDNNLDFIIIYLWDKYSKDFNIGIGQLEAIVKNDIEREFTNTLDNMNLKMIKLKGSYLQYKYYKFINQKGNINV